MHRKYLRPWCILSRPVYSTQRMHRFITSRTLRAASGFRAMNTAAILPPSRPSTPAQAISPAPGNRRYKARYCPLPNSPQTRPKELMLKAEMPGRKPNANHARRSPSHNNGSCFATWEQVQTTSQALPSSSDYESDPPQAGQGTSNAAGQRSQNDDSGRHAEQWPSYNSASPSPA